MSIEWYIGDVQYAMFVSMVLYCGDVVSLGGKYVFATVMCLVLPMCILISCSSVIIIVFGRDYFLIEWVIAFV